MKKILLVALLLCVPSIPAVAAEGSWGIQTANIDSLGTMQVYPGPDYDFRVVTLTLTVDPTAPRSGAAADCTSATVLFLSDPTALELGSNAFTSSLDRFKGLYSGLLGAALLDKQITMSFIESTSPGSCTVVDTSILTN